MEIRYSEGNPIRSPDDEAFDDADEDEYSFDEIDDSNEELLRWLISMITLGAGLPDRMMHQDRLRELLADTPGETSMQSLLAMLLKQRAAQLSQEFVEVMVEFLLESADDPYALIAAIIAYPRLLIDYPELCNVKHYVGMQGTELMLKAATELSSGASAPAIRLMTEITERRRQLNQHEHSIEKMAASLLDAYQWRLP